MKYLIVGLGNIGEEYDYTRHNIGFEVLDAFVKASNSSFKLEKLAYRAEVKFKGRTIICIKPTTYMNLSGKSVNFWMQKENIPLENVLVITDDLALPFGKLRMKGKGSDGGHNGLKDIQAVLNTNKYARLRFGVGSNFHKGKQVDYVLGKWEREEQNQLAERLEVCEDFIKGFTTIGLDRTMSAYNNK